MKKVLKKSVIVGTVAERVYAERSDVLDARAAGAIARHMGMTVAYDYCTGWVGTRPDGKKFRIEPYFSLQYNMRVDGGYFREGHPLVWDGEYRMTPIE